MRFSWLRPRLAPIVSTALALGLACAPSGPPPHPPPSGQLGLPPLESSSPAPFQVIHVGPSGETLADPTIQVAFNKPLRALGAAAVPPPSGLRIVPEVPGAWHWVGTHGLTFVPAAGRLPRSTAFTVEVPASITSVDGEALRAGQTFSFVTPRPELVEVDPNGPYQPVGPRDPVRLTFSAPVQPEALAPFVRVTGPGSVPVKVLADPDAKEGLLVVPQSSWPKASVLTVEVAAGWAGTEGPEKAVDTESAQVHTYGPPRLRLECDRDTKGRCRPGSWFALELDTAVNARLLSSHVRGGAESPISVDTDWWEGATTTYLSLGAKVTPGQAFAVSLSAPIRDVYGQAISSIEGGQTTIGDYRPQARIGFEGQLLLPTVRTVSVHAINTNVTVLERALTPGEFLALERLNWEQRYAHLAGLSGTHSRQLARGTLNRSTSLPVDIDGLLRGGSGAFAIGVRYQLDDGQLVTEVKTGQRSKLGLSVKSGRDHGMVWVTSTDTGAPIAGAEVRVLGGKGAATTDASGVAVLQPGEFAADPEQNEPQFLEVRSGSESCLLSSSETIGPWRLPVSTDFWSKVRDQALVFAERDLFRPGESAWIKGYVRRPARTGSAVLPPETLSLRLTDPNGEVSSTLSVKTNEFGAFSGKLTFPVAAQVGGWSVALLRGPEELGRAEVAVRMYRPAEFEVRVAPSVTEITAGDSVDFRVQGNYFFGGAMARAGAKLWVSRSPEFYVPPGADGYETTDAAARTFDEEGPPSPFLLERESALDDKGLLSQRVVAKLPNQRGPERVMLEAEVTDVSRQALAGRASVLVHPASYYVGILDRDSSFVDVGKAFSPNVIALTPAGKQAAGRTVSLELIRLRWTDVEQEMDAGHRRTVRSLVRESVGRCQGVARGQALCALTAPHAGQYVLRATSQDERGRTVHASRWLYALGGGSAGFRDDAERGTIEVTLDKETYRPGEKARLLVQSPFAAARAWLTLEREGVLSSRVVDLRGATPVVEIPVSEELGPNVFVGVHLLEDRTAAGPKAKPLQDSYRFGYAELALDPERRRLAVEVVAQKKEYRPRDEVQLSFGVKDQAGRPTAAEVAVFVVDEGVLSLSGYQLPDPVAAFAGPRPLRVETIEGREGLARLVGLDPAQGGSKGEPGGDGGDARANFLTAAFFHPGLVTDASGRAQVSFRLPDNLGRFRVMAMAVSTSDRYGTGRTELTVNRPLMARPALPRFLRVGDAFQAGVVVDSQSAEAREVEVQLTAQGLEVAAGAKRTVQVPARGSVLVEFPAKATARGAATLTFRVSGRGAGDDTVRVTRQVQLPSPVETVAAYGRTEQARAERLAALDLARPDAGGLDVTVSASALVGLGGSFEKLEEYPYTCTEQLSSRLLPHVAMKGLKQRFSLGQPDADRRLAERAVAEILGRQKGDGGFGFWPESPESEPWISAYALFALGEAKRAGAAVPDLALKQGRRYLESVSTRREPERLPEAVMAAFSLGRLGHPDVSTLQALFDVRRQMPVFSRALLLWGLADARHTRAAAILKKEIESLVTVRGNRAEVTEPEHERWRHYFASNARLHALVLRALLAVDPKTELAPGLVRALLDAREGGAWSTTQEAAFSLLALETYAKEQEKLSGRLDGQIFVGDEKLGQLRFEPGKLAAQTFSLPMARLEPPSELVVSANGGALFYEARLRFARRTLPTDAVEQGFVVQRALATMDPGSLEATARETLDQSAFPASSLVVSEITVLVPSRRRFVVIDDPLPAGLEAIDFHLVTSGGRQPTTSPDGYSQAWFREEIRDDRVLYFVDDMPAGLYRYRYLARATTPGKYVTPPTRVMEMYQEEVYGRTGARTVEVR